MADVKWIKITTDMFDNRKIKHLRRLPDGESIVLIWVMLLTLAGRCNSNGLIFLTENIPYTPKMLADELDFEESTVQLAIEALDRLDMIHTNSSGFLAISGWEEHQNIEGMEKIRESKRLAQARWRAKQKAIPETSTVDTTVDATEIESDNAEEDKDKNKKKKENKKDKEDDRQEDILTVCELLGKYDYSLFGDAHTGELQETILAFMDFRKSIKKPMTYKAVDLLIGKLKKLSNSIPDQIEILNQSIINGWQGIFPLKGDGNAGKNQNGRLPNSSSEEYGTYL